VTGLSIASSLKSGEQIDAKLFKKVSDARRARNRSFDFARDRLEAYFCHRLERGDRAHPATMLRQSAGEPFSTAV
jgi:hypothetical protein